MKKLQILGTGCAKCQKLTENVTAAAHALGIAYELEKITQIDQIMKFGVMVTPALAVDGVVKVSGKVPDAEAIKVLLPELTNVPELADRTTFILVLPHAEMEAAEYVKNTTEFLQGPLSTAVDSGNTGNIILMSNRVKFEQRLPAHLGWRDALPRPFL